MRIAWIMLALASLILFGAYVSTGVEDVPAAATTGVPVTETPEIAPEQFEAIKEYHSTLGEPTE